MTESNEVLTHHIEQALARELREIREHEADEARKRHRRTLRLTLLLGLPGALLAFFGLMTLLWKLVISGVIVNTVTDAVADELQRKVDSAVAQHVSPINAGLKATIQSRINELEDDITLLEYRQQQSGVGNGHWSTEDAVLLTRKRRRLREQETALMAIKRAEESVR